MILRFKDNKITEVHVNFVDMKVGKDARMNDAFFQGKMLHQ